MKSYHIPPDGFTIFNYEIKFYGLIMALSMLVGTMLACRLAKKRNVKSDDILLLALFVFPFAIIGARLYYCFFYEYNYSFKELFNLRQGGLAIYGGVIGGLIGIIIFSIVKRDYKIIGVLCDVIVPCLILCQAIGRWGNFFNQEAYGNLVTDNNLKWFPYAVFIEDKNAWYQATFFYESLWNLAGFALLLFVFYRSNLTGTTTGFYLVWYGLGRMIIEGLRSDSLYLGSTSIRVSQLLSFALIFVGVALIIFNIIRNKRKKNG